MNQPTISVITICYNSNNEIEKTIKSVLNQNYPFIDYIIIDGGSNDGTLDILKKYESKISTLISEPDNGIYDAMNKGIKLAKGSWINFMNAGDEFYNESICTLIVDNIKISEFDVIYGDCVAIDKDNKLEVVIKSKSLNKFWEGLIFSHQSCFIKSELLKSYLFNLQYKIAADYYQILSLYCDGKAFFYIPTPVSRISIGGVSYSNRETILEQISIVHSKKKYSKRILYYIYPLLLSLIRELLGEKLTTRIREYKWKFLFDVK